MDNTIRAATLFISTKVAEARFNSGITQEALGKAIGLSRTSIVNFEKARHVISVEILLKIAVVLNCKISDLIPTTDWYRENGEKRMEVVITFKEFKN